MEKITRLNKRFVWVLLFLLSAFAGYSQQETYDTPGDGTFIVPTNVTSIAVLVWGAGGHGGNRTSNGRAGGGGGGAYAYRTFTVTPGQTFSFHVGAGSDNSSPGEDTWFNTNTNLMAKGGSSVADNTTTGAAGGTAAASFGAAKYSGGTGATANATYSGGGGSSAGSASAGNVGALPAGGAAPIGGGAGGTGRSSQNDGGDGAQPGGGGGGAFRSTANRDGGKGGNGRVAIWYQDINVKGNGQTIAINSTAPTTANYTDFGSINVTSGTQARTFVIENTGGSTLASIAVTITGAQASDFAVTSAPTSVNATSSQNLIITFDPSGYGARNATVSIESNDPDESPYTFAIRGTGIGSEMSVAGNSVFIADGSTTATTANNTDFGTMSVYSGTIVKTFEVSNAAGASALSITGVTFTGTGNADFTVSPTTATINGGASQTFTVTFNPSAVATRTVTMNFATNDIDNNPYDFALVGRGADPDISIQGNGNTINAGTTSTTASNGTNMGSVLAYGTATAIQTFYVHNLAGAGYPLTINSITSSNAQFTVGSYATGPFAAGTSTPFTVTFDPAAAGNQTTTITVNSNDITNAYTFAVSGVGVSPEIDVQGNGISIIDGDTTPAANDNTNFGTTPLNGGLITKTFTILNTSVGTVPLNLGTISVTGAAASDFTVTQPAVAVLPVNSSTTFTVTFDPSASGQRNATLVIPNDDSNESPYDFSITGFGNDPDIAISGNGVSIVDGNTATSVTDNTDYGSVSIDGGSAVVTYAIANTGVGTLSIGAISFTGAGASNFALLTAPPATLAQGATTTFQVSFTPTTVGTKNARIYIVNDDYDENPYDFSITGLGVRTYPDTDGDGISDNVDIDDDNDGIIDTLDQSNCALSAYSSTYEHTFLNETFGAGTTRGQININIPGATSTYCFEDGIVQPNTAACPNQSSPILDDGEYTVVHRIANTTSGHPDNIHYDLAWNGYEDHTPGDTYGRMAVFNASYEPGVFYETTIQGIMPNVPITYSFWALNIMSKGYYSGTIKPNITVEFRTTADVLIASYNTGDIGRCGTTGTTDNTCTDSQWRNYTTSVNLGNVTSFIIRFKNNAPGGGGNDLALDDITIKQQYCDRDADGVANIFDLDSDNDGIPDIEEAGFGYLSGGTGKMDLTTPGVWVDNNHNGLHDTIDAMIASGTYVLPDTDGDGVKNFQDLDSDNDSLFDVDESGLTNGDGDVNGNGVGDGIDTDRDGILDIFDSFNGWGTQVRPFAQNTDGSGNPDYMQLDSDSNGTFDIAGGLYASLDANNDGKIDGSADADKDGILDSFDTATAALGSPRNLERKLYIDFDGRNDYGEGSQILSGLPQSTIMAWIKIPSGYASDGIVIGQDNFLIRIPTNMQLRATAKGVTVSSGSSNVLQPNRWYHVAAVYDGTASSQQLKLFLNGLQVATSAAGSNSTLSGTLAASTAKFTMAKNSASNANYFNGSIEEVRAFNVALTTDQLQKMVYQEIKQNSAAVRGEFIPKDIELTSWASLLAYYRMDNYKDDVIDNHTTSAIDAGTSTSLARIYNVKNIRYQLAPMPFVTTQSSSLDTAVSQNNFVNGNDIFVYNWSIIDVKHNINLTQNVTSLGVKINPGVTVNLTNNNKMENSWYLKLDGKLDLQDKSQLVQTANSDLDATSSGYVERDQQGTTNLFNYNYWSSPVGAINATTNNNNYTVAGVMKDGTNPAAPVNLNWTTGYNAVATTPRTISSAWIYKFQNMSDAYANWSFVGQNGALAPGQGFTMKGSGAAAESQNYTFKGKPFNGTITLPIAANNINLTGNPYTSAIDANAFITDNAGVINGAIHFWEHFNTNQTHILADYQGGYATYTLVGGTPAIAYPQLSGLGSGSKAPRRFIPVGQGFFVTATATGGNITFKNSQRAFIKEDNADSYTMFRTLPQTTPIGDSAANAQDAFTTVQYPKIRIGYDYASGYHRQVLIGFMGELATSGFDFGYDAENYDDNPDEMVFRIGNYRAVIQGDGYFDATASYPLEVKAAATGNVKFTLDGTENFDDGQAIFIFDKQTGIYHNLRDENFALNIPAGTLAGRFYLRFMQQSQLLKDDEKTVSPTVRVAYDINSSVLSIRNLMEDVTIEKATLINMLGQEIGTYDLKGQDQDDIRITLKNVASGTYVVKMESTSGLMTQKITIK